MPIFLDTGNLADIERFHRMGILRGVTTNPTILLKEGVTGGLRGIEARSKEIARLIAPLPLSVEVTTDDPQQMMHQALTFAGWADNIVVKITIHGPNGEPGNLEVVHKLECLHKVRVNVTAMMSAQQCFLAALAGATYVSIFGGRVNNMGYNVCGEITKLRKLLDRFILGASIIVGSTREVLNVVEWLEAGAHIVTVVPALLEGMLVHPFSKETVQMFLRDAAKAEAVLAKTEVAVALTAALESVRVAPPAELGEPGNSLGHR
ncbi:MAG: transaldolase [Chloroflexi bacterium]|nr:transaldolase [Chloroflexota bacterium]